MAFPIAIFYAAIFLFIGVHMPFWPVWLKAHGVVATEIGILLSVSTWIRAFAPPVIAQIADRTGKPKRLIVMLLAATLGSYALFTLADGFWPLLAISALGAVFFGAILPLIENFAMRASHEHGFDYGRVRLWGSLTFIVGATFGGRLLVGRDADFILTMMLAALGLTLVASLGLPTLAAAKSQSTRLPIADLLSKPIFIVFLLAGGLTQASHAAYYGFATLHWRAAGIADDVIGWLWAEGVIAEVALFTFSGAVARRLGPMRLLGLGVIAGLVRWCVLGLTTEIWALVAVQGLHALTFAATHLAAMHFLLRAVPAPYSSTAQGLYSGLGMGVLMGLAMILAGVLFGNFGGAAFISMAALSLAGGVAAIALARMWRGGEII
ncbi:MAG: MFS transporter [Rhodospirillaceae bacterium]|jgi:MFS transporter, PPP family, 3-phenylpropionic acid transporter|nr:MFS transporter [Rhodospirillaceae bacterium]